MFHVLAQRFALLKPYQRSLLSGLAGFVFYGAWAFWVNQQHGIMIAGKAACVQGSYSFALTFFMTSLIEIFFRFFSNLLKSYRLVIWATVLLTCCLVFSTSWWVNVLAKTPEILETVILGYVVGGVYTVIYVYSLANVAQVSDSLES